MVILVDMDDTIENLLTAWCKYLNDKHGLTVKANDIDDWKVSKFYPTLTDDDVFEPLYSEAFWETVLPREDAVEYVKKLFDDGHDIYVVTASDYRTIKSKFDCIINRHFPYIDWNHVIVAHNKQMIIGDVLIDDGPHNLEGGSYKKILMTVPHNKRYDAAKNDMKRVCSWGEVYAEIKRMQAEDGNA